MSSSAEGSPAAAPNVRAMGWARAYATANASATAAATTTAAATSSSGSSSSTSPAFASASSYSSSPTPHGAGFPQLPPAPAVTVSAPSPKPTIRRKITRGLRTFSAARAASPYAAASAAFAASPLASSSSSSSSSSAASSVAAAAAASSPLTGPIAPSPFAACAATAQPLSLHTVPSAIPSAAKAFPGESVVRASRFSGVAIASLGREQLMLSGAPTLLERSLSYLETAIVRGIEFGVSVPGAGKPVATRVDEWTPARVAAWIEEELGVRDCCVRIVQQRISGRKLRRLRADDLLNVFGDECTRQLVAERARALAQASSRGLDILKGKKLQDKDIFVSSTLLQMWDSGCSVVDYYALKVPPKVVSLMVKHYLRALPEPLMPAEPFLSIAAHSGELSSEKLREELLTAMSTLAPANRVGLQRLVDFCFSITTHPFSSCKGQLDAVTRIFAPFIARPFSERDESYYAYILSSLASLRTFIPAPVLDRPVTFSGDFFFGEVLLAWEPNIRCYFGEPAPGLMQGLGDGTSFLVPRNWLHGTLFITNYRVMWRCAEPAADRDRSLALAEPREIPATALLRVMVPRDIVDKPDVKFEGPLVGKLISRNFLPVILQFGSVSSLSKVTEDLQKLNTPSAFAAVNRELNYVSDQTRRELGWEFFRAEEAFAPAVAGGQHEIVNLAPFARSISDDVYPRRCALPSSLARHITKMLEKRVSIPAVVYVLSSSGGASTNFIYRSCAYRVGPRKPFCTTLQQQAPAVAASAAGGAIPQDGMQLPPASQPLAIPSHQGGAVVTSSSGSAGSPLSPGSQQTSPGTQPDKKGSGSSSGSGGESRQLSPPSAAAKSTDQDESAISDFISDQRIQVAVVADSTIDPNELRGTNPHSTVTLPVPGSATAYKHFMEWHTILATYKNTKEWRKQLKAVRLRWLRCVQDVLLTGVMVSKLVEHQGQSVFLQPFSEDEEELVSALCSLATIMLDPAARTLEGFIKLIERDWLAFGFPFLKTHGDEPSEDGYFASFIVFLDCVWQLWTCFPSSFAFSDHLLLFIADSVHSGRFGTFQINVCCNDCADAIRARNEVASLWAFLNINAERFSNRFYDPEAGASILSTRFSDEFTVPHLWSPYFLRWKGPPSIDEYLASLQPQQQPSGSTSVSLSLSGMRLVSFPLQPTPISIFTPLTAIDLSDNELPFFPPCLFYCSNLVKANLASNNLGSSFTTELVQLLARSLPNLEELDLSHNGIAYLPANFTSLTALRTLSLGRNAFTIAPSCLFDMANLRVLSLAGGLGRTPFPLALSRLLNLEELCLRDNQLTRIDTKELEPLVKLRVLDLSNNEIASLDDFPAQALTELRSLNLCNNEIEMVPIKFAHLVNLVSLDVSRNKLAELSPAIGSLKQLSRLAIDGNLLTMQTLPPTLALLPSLSAGDFVHDPGLFPPECRTTSAKLASLAPQLEAKVKTYRGSIFLLGNPATGKTVLMQCLIKRFKKHSSNMQSISTDGVDIIPWEFDWRFQGDDQTRHICTKAWDFAGQVIYTSTHQFFLSDRGLYILVWKIPAGESACRIHFWLNIISTATKTPTVFVVGTHTDSDEVVSSRVEKMLADLKQKYSRLFPRLSLHFRAVSNLTKEGIKKLRNEVKAALVAQPQMGEVVPLSHLLLEKQIRTWHVTPPMISRKDWQFTAQCCNIRDEDELTRATAFLHAVGSLMCFQSNAALRNYVILEPQWLTKTLATVITHKHAWVKNGMLRKSDLVHIWRPPEFPQSVHTIILKLLEVFNVMFWLPLKNVPQMPADSAAAAPSSPSPAKPLSASTSALPTATSVSPPVATSSPHQPIFLGTQRVAREHSQLQTTLSPPPAPASVLASSMSPPLAAAKPLEPTEDSVLFLPALLPDSAPESLGKLWPPYHTDDEEEAGRQYSFLCIPEGLFSKLLVIFSHTYRFLAIWRNGVVMEVKRSDTAVTAMAMIQQKLEANLVIVRLRYTTRGGGTEVVEAGTLLRRLLGEIGSVIREWFNVNVGTSVECASCLKKGIAPPFLFRFDVCDTSVILGKQNLHCETEDENVPLACIVPDLVMEQMSLAHKQIAIDPAQVELHEVVGEGSAASVYKALYKGDVVAVKQFKLEREGLGPLADQAPAYDLSVKMTECRREIAIMSEFRHPNILQLRGLILQPLSLVIEFVSGGTLYDFLHRAETTLFWPLRLKLAHEIASAVFALHSKHPPVLHRDLKSPNVLLRLTTGDRFPSAVLCDFGLSGEFSPHLTAVADNPAWIAPEVLRREKYTLKADVYSMGVVMWEITTRSVFMGNCRFMSEIADAVMSGKRPEMPTVPERVSSFARLVNQCWAQEPSDRPTFGEITETLNLVRQIAGEEDF